MEQFHRLKTKIIEISFNEAMNGVNGAGMKGKATTRSLAGIAFLFGTSLLLASAACGQMTTRSLSGTVTDRQHEPLTGAVIQVQNGVTNRVVSYITNRDGKYSFKRLDGETDYRLWVNFRGKRSRVRKLSQFDSDRPKVIDFILNLN